LSIREKDEILFYVSNSDSTDIEILDSMIAKNIPLTLKKNNNFHYNKLESNGFFAYFTQLNDYKISIFTHQSSYDYSK
jgi:hypothetical protein